MPLRTATPGPIGPGLSKIVDANFREHPFYSLGCISLGQKSLWDWLNLLIVPVVLAIGGFWVDWQLGAWGNRGSLHDPGRIVRFADRARRRPLPGRHEPGHRAHADSRPT